MWLARDVQAVPLDRRGKRDRFEELRTRAGEQRDAVERRIDAAHVLPDAFAILFEAGTHGRTALVGLDPVGEFFPQELVESIAAVFVGPQIEIETDDRKRTGIECGELVELFGELIDGRHTASLRKPYADGAV